MKKLSIYITVLLAAALTACNEDFNEGVASPTVLRTGRSCRQNNFYSYRCSPD